MKEHSLWLELQALIRSRPLLSPVALFFRLLSWFFLTGAIFRKKWLRRVFPLIPRHPTISIGSVTVGGAGKTPVTLFLMKLFSSFSLAYVSRGYGRQKKGEVLIPALHLTSSQEVGDEAFLVASHVPTLLLSIGSSKKKNMERIQSVPLDFVFLDDGLQRYDILAQYEIGVLPSALFYEKEELLPLGLLREPIDRLRQVDLLFVIKEEEERAAHELFEKAKQIAPAVLVEHRLSGWKDIAGNRASSPGKQVAFLSGIARPYRVVRFLEKLGYDVVATLSRKDHESLMTNECLAWKREWEEKGATVIATEKDWARHVPWQKEWLGCLFMETELQMLLGQENVEQVIRKIQQT